MGFSLPLCKTYWWCLTFYFSGKKLLKWHYPKIPKLIEFHLSPLLGTPTFFPNEGGEYMLRNKRVNCTSYLPFAPWQLNILSHPAKLTSVDHVYVFSCLLVSNWVWPRGICDETWMKDHPRMTASLDQRSYSSQSAPFFMTLSFKFLAIYYSLLPSGLSVGAVSCVKRATSAVRSCRLHCSRKGMCTTDILAFSLKIFSKL